MTDPSSERTAQASIQTPDAERRLRALYDLSHALVRAETLERIYELALNGLCDSLNADRASVLLFDRLGVMRFTASNGLSQNYQNKVEGHSPWPRDKADAQPILVEDVEQADFSPELRQTILEEGIRALAFLPLYSGSGLLGKFMVYYDRPHRMPPADVALAEAIAGHVVYAIERQRSDEATGRLAAIVESSNDAIVSKNLNSVITSWNMAAQQLFGYTPEEAIGKPVYILIPPDRHDEETVILSKIRAGQRVEHYDTVRVTKDGLLIDVSLTISPVRDSRGTIVGASKIARDISERKRAEEALRHSQHQMQIITDAMAAPVARLDRAMRYTWVSKRYAKWAGANAEDVVGRTIEEVLGGSRLDAIRPHIERVLAGEQVRFEDRIPTKGQERWVNATYSPTRDEYGKIDGWVEVVVDVSEAKEADRRKDEFLATLAHELRNPLAPIRNAVSLMQAKGYQDFDVQTVHGIIDRQVQHMARLVDDLMDISRITRGRILLQVEQVELRRVVMEAVESVQPFLDEAGHTLATDLPDEEIRFPADPMRLAQIISNLLNNASKYTENGGRIELSARRENGEIRIGVKDNGIGIDSSRILGIFEMFAQEAPALHRAQGGLGIGLSLVKGLVTLHGGRVEASSAGIGKGSEFTIYLPIKPANKASLLPTAETANRSGSAKRHRILVVDDNADNAESLGLLLVGSGHLVQLAYDGEEAVEAAARFGPTVVLLDIGLPKMNGYEAARRIRILPEGKDIRLIAISGWGQEQDKVRAKEAGFDYHLTKPVEIAALEELIRNGDGHKETVSSPSGA